MATYLKFHELDRSPFEGPGSDRFVLATEALRRAFAEIKTGLDEGAPRVCVSGGPGMGKSSLARALPKLLAKEARAALVRDPSRDWSRVKASIAKQLNLEAGQLSRASLLTARPQGQRLVLILDEAEHLPAESLEQLDALLGYRDDDGAQLLQCVILANLEDAPRGQDVPLLWWLDQLTTRQLMMAPIPENGLRSYVEKHLKKAGAPNARLFEDDALRAIHRYTGGVPGAVSALCEQLLDKAASNGTRTVTAALVAAVFGDPPPEPVAAPAARVERPTPEPRIDHSNTPPAPDSDSGFPEFGGHRAVGSTPGPGSTRADAFGPPMDTFAAPEPELKVQQGLLPVEETNNYADESDFFAGPGAAEEPTRGRATPLTLGGPSPGSGRSARAVRNLILLAVLAVLAAVGHAWWRESGESIVLATWRANFDEETKTPRARPVAPPRPEREVSRDPRDPETGIHPLVPPSDRELALRSLALEDKQGRQDDPAPHGLTSDLKLLRAGGDATGAAPRAPGEAAPESDPSLSLSDLYEIADKSKADGRETAPSPWTQENPAAPAPGR